MPDEPKVYMVKKEKISEEEFNYCFHFVIESALKLQEFDFVIKKEGQLYAQYPLTDY